MQEKNTKTFNRDIRKNKNTADNYFVGLIE